MKSKTKQKNVIAKSENILYKHCSKEWHLIIDNTIQLFNFKKNETIISVLILVPHFQLIRILFFEIL